MKLTREYLEAVDSITLQHSGCDCEVTGEWFAQDGDAIIKIDKCKCAERPIEGVGEAIESKYICDYCVHNDCQQPKCFDCEFGGERNFQGKKLFKASAPTVQEGGKSDE